MTIFYFLTIMAFANSQTATDPPVAMPTTESARTEVATTDPGTTAATMPVTVTEDPITVTVTVGPIIRTEIQQLQTTSAPGVLIAPTTTTATTTTTDPTLDPVVKEQNEVLNYVKSIGFRNAFIHEDHIDADRSLHGSGTTTVKPITSSTVSTTTRPQHGAHVSSDAGVGNDHMSLLGIIMVLTYYIM